MDCKEVKGDSAGGVTAEKYRVMCWVLDDGEVLPSNALNNPGNFRSIIGAPC